MSGGSLNKRASRRIGEARLLVFARSQPPGTSRTNTGLTMNDDGFGTFVFLIAIVGYFYWMSDGSGAKEPHDLVSCKRDAFHRYADDTGKMYQDVMWCMEGIGYEPDFAAPSCSSQSGIFLRKECYRSTAWYAEAWRSMNEKK